MTWDCWDGKVTRVPLGHGAGCDGVDACDREGCTWDLRTPDLVFLLHEAWHGLLGTIEDDKHFCNSMQWRTALVLLSTGL